MLNQLIKISIIVGVLAISLSISYYFVYFLPEHEKTKLEVQKQMDEAKRQHNEKKEIERQNQLHICLNIAQQDNAANIRANCKGTENCSMPLALASAIQKKYKDEQDLCYQRYPPLISSQ